MKILLHSCCAPCSTPCLTALKEEGHEVSLYWFNPNIHPYTEYRSRRESLRHLAAHEGVPLIEEDQYGLRSFIEGTRGMEDREGGRCTYCYKERLRSAAKTAAEQGFGAFSTSLLISPYQDHGAIKAMGEEWSRHFGIEFFYRDFRPLFRTGQDLARERGYYMQSYCGCIYSEEERYR
ncbi:MAG: epoxyqueuosine reductase QueH [Treponema sp.]|nr:epoxyqueuosine reductase QueH [Treponema sp.]